MLKNSVGGSLAQNKLTVIHRTSSVDFEYDVEKISRNPITFYYSCWKKSSLNTN